MSRDWDRELAKIDRQLASLSDDALGAPPAPGGAGRPAPARGTLPPEGAPGPAAVAPPGGAPSAPGGRLGVVVRLLLALAVAAAVMAWPYDTRCGIGLAGYFGAIAGVVLAGGWSAVWTWRHRAARAHLLAIAVVAWGLALAAVEVLPRVGYARTDPARMLWVCE